MELHDESASEQYAPPEMDDDASLTADESPESPRNTTKGGRRRKDSPDYRSMFLVSSPSRIRFQTYISQEVYDKVKVFLPVIAPNTSITSFINNVLNHHMMQYQEEINSLYFKHLSKKPVDYEKD